MSNRKDDLLSLFYRPNEPIFMPKANGVTFDVPTNYLTDNYKSIVADIQSKFQNSPSNTIRIQPVSKLPDITRIKELGRNDNFSLFIPRHREYASQLISILMGLKSREEFKSVCVYLHDRVNAYLYVYAMSVATLHRPDTRNEKIPSLAELFPEKFMDCSVFARAREEAAAVQNPSMRRAIEIPRDYSASDLDPEHLIAYWREDIGVNLHHWYWHLVYPALGPRNIVNKDRRGELFYYQHEQIVGRYDFERLSNRLGRCKRFANFREPIPEAYFPKLDSSVASRNWPPRHRNAVLSDINRESESIKFDISDLERWRDRILEAIAAGSVTTASGSIPLDEVRGIDILGNIIEASILSVNSAVYGDVHNMGHLAIALLHDPDHRYLEGVSVMGDPATDMRDPIFYRWHAMIDYMFQQHKNKLPQYTAKQLTFDGITITKVEVQNEGSSTAKNEFSTSWQQSDTDLSRGLDFAPGGLIRARFTHLQHIPFTYKISVNNTGNPGSGTVRIFLAPKFNEKGSAFQFNDQRLLFIELDKFVTSLRKGSNLIERRSVDSAVTIPFEFTFRNLENIPEQLTPAAEEWNFCSCGWPQHLLLPKGTAEGMSCDLFVMISNWAEDKVEGAKTDVGCDDAASYCGRRDSLYPDKKAMGYPFDRRPRQGVVTLKQFLTPNMFALDVKIKHVDRIIPRASNSRGGGRPK